jgi:hypothetical protein
MFHTRAQSITEKVGIQSGDVELQRLLLTAALEVNGNLGQCLGYRLEEACPPKFGCSSLI